MKTTIGKLCTDWVDVKNKCRVTVNKSESTIEATKSFKEKLLISEHSPIRLLRVSWKWSLKSWVATHFARHHIGWEKWIGTQRDDRKSPSRDSVAPLVTRDSARQDTIVPMSIEANAQALINIARVRLCYCSQNETREHMEDLKRTLYSHEPEIASVMQKNCVYRCGCPEFVPCGWWESFTAKHSDIDMLSITERYKAANEDFLGGKQ